MRIGNVLLVVVVASSIFGRAGSAIAQSSSYADGLSDRTNYERWFAALSPSEQAGATFWASERSELRPAPCASAAPAIDQKWLQGCVAAKAMLDPDDGRRKAEPSYRSGWNSYQEQPTTHTAALVPPVTIAPPSPMMPPPPPMPPRPTATQAELDAMSADCGRPTGMPGSPEFAAQLNAALGCQAYRNNARQALEQRQRDYEAAVADRARRIEAQAAQVRAQAEQQQRETEQQQRAAADLVAEQERQRQIADAASRQLAAETSPDNICAAPDTARMMLHEMNDMDNFQRFGVKFLDIEHLTTADSDDGSIVMRCHGTFVTNHMIRLSGTFTVRKNIAGDPIDVWSPDR